MFTSSITLASLRWLGRHPARGGQLAAMPALALSLQAGQVLSLTLRPGQRLRVDVGRVWLTAALDPADHVLAPGQAWVATRRQRVLIEALDRPARLSPLQDPAG